MKHYNASGSVVQISQKCGTNFAEVWYKFRRGVVQISQRCGTNFAEVWYKKSDNPLFYKTLKALKFP